MDFLLIYLINLLVAIIANIDVYIRNIPNFVSDYPQIAYLLAMAFVSLHTSIIGYLIYLFMKKVIANYGK